MQVNPLGIDPISIILLVMIRPVRVCRVLPENPKCSVGPDFKRDCVQCREIHVALFTEKALSPSGKQVSGRVRIFSRSLRLSYENPPTILLFMPDREADIGG